MTLCLGADGEESENPVLVMVDSGTVLVFAHLANKKGPDTDIICLILSDMELLGHRKIMFKSDQEPAIVALQKEVNVRRPGVALENSLVGESETNGLVENAIQRVTGMVRTIKSALGDQHQAD